MPFDGQIPFPIRSEGYLPRGGYVAGFGTSSAFGDQTERLGVPVGLWLEVESTLVSMARFDLNEDGQTGSFFVEFAANRSLGVYADAPVRDWADFVASPSHGVWLANVYFPKGLRPRKIQRLIEGTWKASKQEMQARDVGFKSDAWHRAKSMNAARRLGSRVQMKSAAYGRK